VHTHTFVRTAARLAAGLGATQATAHAPDATQARPAELGLLAGVPGFSVAGSQAGFRPGGIDQLTRSAGFVARVGVEHMAGAGRETQADVRWYISAVVVGVGQP
jgi:hypothetical protein